MSVGTGVGTYYIKQRFEIGLVATEVSNWHLGFAPEAGVFVPVVDSASLNLSVRYNYTGKSGQDVSGQETGYQYVSLNIGFYSDAF